ncbi:MAG: zinc ribbon domain-containing protein, partial [Promethearchaeota archaeon]
MAAVSDKELDPNIRYFEAEGITKKMVYDAVRNGVEEIGIVDDADPKKGVVVGIVGKKKFKVSFGKDKKKDLIYIKIDHSIPLNDIKRMDIRQLSPEKFPSRLIVTFWDEVYNALGLGQAPGFGEFKRLEVSSDLENSIKEIMRARLSEIFNSDPRIKKIIFGYNSNFEEIMKKYKWELNTLNNYGRWKESSIFGIEFYLDRQKKTTLVLLVNRVDMKTFKLVPLEIIYFISLPRAIPASINMSYKGLWSSSNALDETTQRILNHLNYEEPALESELKSLYSTKTYYNFVGSEKIDEKGKKSVIKYDEIMFEPINIIPINDPTSDDEKYLMAFRFFLKLLNNGDYANFPPVYETINIMNKLFTILKRYFVLTEEDKKKKSTTEETEEKTEEIRKCPKCGWLLSKNAKTCPVCGAEVVESKKTTFGVDSSAFDEKTALQGAKAELRSRKLFDSLDKVLEEFDNADAKRKNIVISNIEAELDELRQIFDINIIKDESEIKNIVGKLFQANTSLFNREQNTLARYLIKMNSGDMKFKWLYITVDKIITQNEDSFPIMLSYIIEGPYVGFKFSFVKNEDLRKKRIKYEWEVDIGQDPEVVIYLNEKDNELKEMLNNIYNAPYRTKFIEPIIDPKKNKIVGTEFSIDLYPIIRVEPSVEKSHGKHDIVILRQFLDNEYGGLGGVIPLNKVISVLNKIYAALELYEGTEEKSEKKEPDSYSSVDSFDFSILDQKLEQSNYKTPQNDSASNSTNIPGMEITDQELNAAKINIDESLNFSSLDELDSILEGTSATLEAEANYKTDEATGLKELDYYISQT